MNRTSVYRYQHDARDGTAGGLREGRCRRRGTAQAGLGARLASAGHGVYSAAGGEAELLIGIFSLVIITSVIILRQERRRVDIKLT
jgi:hypothetical protein